MFRGEPVRRADVAGHDRRDARGRGAKDHEHQAEVRYAIVRSVDALSDTAVPSYAGASTDGFSISRDAKGRARPAGVDTITPSVQGGATSRLGVARRVHLDNVRWKAMGRTLAPR